MSKKLMALVGLLAVCGFMTGCCKKKCEPKGAARQYKTNKKADKKGVAHKNKKDVKRGY